MKAESASFADYLLLEFEMLHSRAQNAEQSIANKVNYFLASASAIVAGLFLGSTSQTLQPFLLPLALLLTALMFAIGISTLRQVVDLSAVSTFFRRRCGRLRRWFFDNYTSESIYFPFTPTDERPTYFERREGNRNVEGVLVLANAASGALVIGISILLWEASRIALSVISGLVTFMLVMAVQQLLIRHYLLSIETEDRVSGNVRFPRADFDRQ